MSYLEKIATPNFEKQEKLLAECFTKRTNLISSLKIVQDNNFPDDVKTEFIETLEKKLTKCDRFITDTLNSPVKKAAKKVDEEPEAPLPQPTPAPNPEYNNDVPDIQIDLPDYE